MLSFCVLASTSKHQLIIPLQLIPLIFKLLFPRSQPMNKQTTILYSNTNTAEFNYREWKEQNQTYHSFRFSSSPRTRVIILLFFATAACVLISLAASHSPLKLLRCASGRVGFCGEGGGVGRWAALGSSHVSTFAQQMAAWCLASFLVYKPHAAPGMNDWKILNSFLGST